jgi:hypothetical protein
MLDKVPYVIMERKAFSFLIILNTLEVLDITSSSTGNNKLEYMSKHFLSIMSL